MIFSKPPQRRVRRFDTTTGYQPLATSTPGAAYTRAPVLVPARRSFRRLPIKWRLAGSLAVVGILVIGASQLHWRTIFDRAEAAAFRSSHAQFSAQLSAIFQANPKVAVGVAVANLSNNTVETYGQTTPFTAASTTKLVTAIDFLSKVENGTYSLAGPLGDDTAGWQLQELVNQSDDDSWDLFNTLLGGDQITAYAHSIGLSSFEFDTNSITPADEAVMLEKLYEGKLLNPTDTKLLLSYMQHTNDDSLIPAALPAAATVYHKYGELLTDSGNYVHDAAIISYAGQTFVLTIYTNRSDLLDLQTRQQMIHQITRDVVKYIT